VVVWPGENETPFPIKKEWVFCNYKILRKKHNHIQDAILIKMSRIKKREKLNDLNSVPEGTTHSIISRAGRGWSNKGRAIMALPLFFLTILLRRISTV